MTPDDLELDRGSIDTPLLLYRLAKNKYANLSGIGAARYPGRWNRLAQPAIYTSPSIALCVLELLVHSRKDEIPTNYSLMTIRVDDADDASIWTMPSLKSAKERFADPRQDWPGRYRHATITAGVERIIEGHNLGVAVPSVIVPDWNVILFPDHHRFFQHVSLVSVEPFEFDPRIFPEGIPADTILNF